jgi:hypothetical protein
MPVEVIVTPSYGVQVKRVAINHAQFRHCHCGARIGFPVNPGILYRNVTVFWSLYCHGSGANKLFFFFFLESVLFLVLGTEGN